MFEQDGIRVIHCMDDFESSTKYIYPRSVFGQLLTRCQEQGEIFGDYIKEQLAEKDSDGQYDLPMRKTKHYPIGTVLNFSLKDEDYRIVAFNHWDEEGYITKYTIDEYRSFLKRLWKYLMREGKNSTINITLMGNNFTAFTGAQPDTEQKIWMILESLFDAAHDGFRCDQLRICIGENDVEQIKFTGLKSILRYLDKRQY